LAAASLPQNEQVPKRKCLPTSSHKVVMPVTARCAGFTNNSDVFPQPSLFLQLFFVYS
jgi:hypothetical protein